MVELPYSGKLSREKTFVYSPKSRNSRKFSPLKVFRYMVFPRKGPPQMQS